MDEIVSWKWCDGYDAITINHATTTITPTWRVRTGPVWPYANQEIEKLTKRVPLEQGEIPAADMLEWLARAMKSPDRQRVGSLVFDRAMIRKAMKTGFRKREGNMLVSIVYAKEAWGTDAEALVVQKDRSTAIVMPMRVGPGDVVGKDPLRLRWW